MGLDPKGPPETLGLADRLRAAMERKGITSNRGLAVRLVGNTTDDRQIERWRKQIRRMLAGNQRTVQPATAEALSAALDVPVRYWPTERSVRPIHALEAAEDLLRRLGEGETIPAEDLEAAAVRVDETAALFAAIAAQLRASAANEHSAP